MDSDWQAFVNVSRSAEVPTFDVNNFGAPASSTVDAQTATTYEVGTRGQRPDATWDLSFYHAAIKKELQCLTNAAAPGSCTVRNADKTVHRGAEVGLGIALFGSLLSNGDRVWFNTNYTNNDFFFDGDPTYGRNKLPGVPPQIVLAEILYKGSNGLYLGPNIEWIPKAFLADNANHVTIDPYSLLNLRLGYGRDKAWSYYPEGRNLANKRYLSSTIVVETADETSALFNPGAGQSVHGGVRYQW